MRSATAAAVEYAKKEFAKLGYPANPEEFVHGLGVKIILGSDNYATNGPPAIISQTPDSYAPRQRFTIFHEAGHVLVQRGGFEDDIMAEVDSEDSELHLEMVVNHIAGYFLIPDPLIKMYVKKYGLSSRAVLKVQAKARASFAATSRRFVGHFEEQPVTIFLGGETYLLDVASSDPWNRLRRYDRIPDYRAILPDADLLTLTSIRPRTVGVLAR